MKITHDNYTAYLLDYCEGNLSADDTEELMRFLDENPQYREELEEFEHIELEMEEERFTDKQSLKKRTSLTAEEFFELSEGTVAGNKKEEFFKIISGNEVLEKELRLWNASKVTPDLSVVFPGKEKLKHQPVVISLWSNKVFMRAAAAVAVLCSSLAVYFFLNSGEPSDALHLYSSDNQLQLERGVSIDQADNKNNSSLAVQPKYANSNKVKKQQKKSLTTVIENNVAVVDSFKATFSDSVKLAIEKQPENPVTNTPDTTSEHNAIVTHTEEKRGVWGPEEVLLENKPGIRRRVLELAYDCLNGLKKLGVKKAEAVKKADPESGAVDYILVLGDRGLRAKDE